MKNSCFCGKETGSVFGVFWLHSWLYQNTPEGHCRKTDKNGKCTSRGGKTSSMNFVTEGKFSPGGARHQRFLPRSAGQPGQVENRPSPSLNFAQRWESHLGEHKSSYRSGGVHAVGHRDDHCFLGFLSSTGWLFLHGVPTTFQHWKLVGCPLLLSTTHGYIWDCMTRFYWDMIRCISVPGPAGILFSFYRIGLVVAGLGSKICPIVKKRWINTILFFSPTHPPPPHTHIHGRTMGNYLWNLSFAIGKCFYHLSYFELVFGHWIENMQRLEKCNWIHEKTKRG